MKTRRQHSVVIKRRKMAHILYIFVCLCVYVVCASATKVSEPRVSTPSGIVVGSAMRSRRGRDIHAYRGLRYAEPPVGDLRFKPPVPITRYWGEVDGREEGPACPQPASDDYYLDEDCLRLNVYTPGNVSDSSSLPVLVYMHAGGFYSVSGRSDVAGPHYLLDHDMILVAINYRLGSLGFLSTGDSVSPGNNGFKDQVAALRWVRRNIRAFGGDPDLVTIAGYSAGSISVALHAVSPMSKGLFHRAVSMSGSPYSQLPFKRDLLSLAVKQARLVDCPIDSTQAMVDCLRRVPWRKLGDSLEGFREFSIDPILIWTPVIEADWGQERFLCEHPYHTLKKGLAVPFIVSQTRDEFFWEAFLVLDNSIYTSLINTEWYSVAPSTFLLPSPSDEAATRLREYYQLNTISNSSVDARHLGKLYGDGVIGFGVHRLMKLLSRHNAKPTYYYLFDYIGNQSHYVRPDTGKPAGVAHHDELIYLFTIPTGFKPIPLDDSEDSNMVDKLTTTLYNFMKTGDPNPLPAHDAPTWPPVTGTEQPYLRVGAHYSLGENLFRDRFQEWEQLYPLDYTLKDY